MSIEVEQKFPLADRQALVTQLVALGCQLGEHEEHLDTYFAHPLRDFAQTDEALRLRQIGRQHYITYKGPKLDQATKTRREIEIELLMADREPADGHDLLLALGFRPVRQVRKRRQTTVAHWQATPIEICLDTVDRLGDFVELEIVTDEQGLPAARLAIQAFATDLGLSKPERRSYLELLLAAGG